jgi:hypothetical protein
MARNFLLALLLLSEAPACRAGLPAGVRVIRDIPYVPNAAPRQRLDLYLPEQTGSPRPLLCLHPWRRLDGGLEERVSVPGIRESRVRGREHRVPVQPGRDLPGADRGLQGGDPLAAGARGGVRDRSEAGGSDGGIGRRTPGGVAGHDGAGEGIRCRAEPRSIERGAVRGGFFRADGFPALRDVPAVYDDSPNALVARSCSESARGCRARKPRPRGCESPIYYVTAEAAPFLILHGDHDPAGAIAAEPGV